MCLDRHTTSPEQGCLVPFGSDDLSELPCVNFWEPFLVLVDYMVYGNELSSLRCGGVKAGRCVITSSPDSSAT